jgi:O-6-methylguanine DNA methyltransferase
MLTFEVPIGGISVAESGGAVIAISMGMAGREEFQQALLQRGYSPRLGETTVLQSAHRQLTEYFSGRRRSFSLPFRLEGTAFQKAVWQVLSTIPYGETRSYGEVAAAVARPKGARAVGQAVGSNRLGILIPCHRVVAAGGKLGGFGCGLEMKKFLLQLEREHSTPAMRE